MADFAKTESPEKKKEEEKKEDEKPAAVADGDDGEEGDEDPVSLSNSNVPENMLNLHFSDLGTNILYLR